MAIKLVHRERRECACLVPRKGDYVEGDVVQCTDCETYWRCTGWSPRDPYKPGDENILWEKVRKLVGRNDETVWGKF